MKKITLKQQIKIYERLLLRLHTAAWTGNYEVVRDLLDRIGKYSYARTNTNEGNEKQEERQRIETLLDLDK